ncbi:hypothetical protein F4808DRAFT_471422 [Astrocystis sublimbata]|nr:hypothetical protein F4808DRAFT_471422 [Astrocystis sublimbata]
MAPIANDGGPGRPLSVKEISARAAAFDWNPNIPFKHWLHTSQLLQQQADMYLRDGNFAQAYLLYLRYSTLVVDLLRQHPEAKTQENKKAFQSKLFTVDVVFKHLEEIKPILDRQYKAYKEAKAKQGADSDRLGQSSAGVPQEPSAYQQHASNDPALSYAAHLLDAGENQDLAVELAQREMRRRDSDRKANISNSDGHRGQQQRRNAGFWDTLTQDIADKQAEEEEFFREKMETTSKALGQDTDPPSNGLRRPATRLVERPSVPSYSYPKIAKSAPVDYKPQYPHSNEGRPVQPPLPPKQEAVDRSFMVPERPQKTPYPSESLRELPSRPPKLPDSAPEPPKKQQGVAFKPAAYLENGEPIRPIFLPRQLRRQFLEIASENTKRGLEMCGILCGTAVNNALFVRCLLIPEQKCTSDTCETENEATILEYCIEEDLLMLGWIHTHPTQTCFMSSRDLHTQSGYQVMLPESIAIVCAPKFEPSYGIFRLTNPPGLPHILGCTQSSTFHAHSVENLYTGAEHPPGHVYEHNGLSFYVQDIRPGARNSAVPNNSF